MKINLTEYDITVIKLTEQDMNLNQISIDINRLIRMEIEGEEVKFYNKLSELNVESYTIEKDMQIFVYNSKVVRKRSDIEDEIFMQLFIYIIAFIIFILLFVFLWWAINA